MQTITTRNINRRINRGLTFRPNGVYNYIQTVSGAAITGMANRYFTQNSSDQFKSLEFSLNNCAQSVTFAALYDQYKITKIVVTFTPMITAAVTTDVSSTLTAVNGSGIFATVIDYDGGTALTTLDQMREYQTYKQQPVISTFLHTRTWVPRTNASIQDVGGGVSSSDNRAGRWLDCGNTNVVHYGLRLYMDQRSNIYNTQQFEVSAKYYLSFRQVR